MALARPITIVYQELANTSSTPATPQLPAMIVGPAYVIKDYPDDAASILLSSTYGLADRPAAGASVYTPPLSGADAVTLSNYPDNRPGAVVDHDSVRVWLRQPRVILGSTYLSSTIAPVISTKAATSSAAPEDLNLVTFTGGVDLNTICGVRAGDRLIITDSTGLVTLVRTVLSVGQGGTGEATNTLRVTQNFPASGWTYDGNGEARIERILSTQELVDTSGTFITFPEPTANTMVLKGGILCDITIGTSTVQRAVSYAQLYVGYRALRQDLQTRGSCVSSELTTKLLKYDARNPLCVGVFMALQNSGGTPVYFYGVRSDDAVGYAMARDALSSYRDLYSFVPLTMDDSVLLAWKNENVTLSDPTQASTTGVVQKFRVVMGGHDLPTEETISPSSTIGVAVQSGAKTDLYRTVNVTAPGGADISAILPGGRLTIGLVPVAANWATRRGTHYIGHVNSTTSVEVIPGNVAWEDTAGETIPGVDGVELRFADRNGVVIHERLARLATTHGTATLTTYHRDPVTSGSAYRLAFVAGAPGCDCVASLSGGDITVTFDNGVDTVADAVAAMSASPDVNAVVTNIVTGDSGQLLAGAVAASLAIAAATSAMTVTKNDNLYDILQDADATFMTSGVLPGDVVQIPLSENDGTATAFDGGYTSYVVDSLISENRLKIVAVTDDTASAGIELPHLYSRARAVLVNNTPPLSLRYRVQRTMSKDDQVDALAAASGSFLSKRAVLCWPDRLYVSGLVDGSLARSNAAVPEPAGEQPSYYIACAVAGACSGLPAQYGLTNFAFAGIERLVHATDYFTDYQMTRISDAGWFVLQQDAPDAGAYCIHQCTTDPTAVETGELSVVKTFDYDSIVFMNALQPFIGRYNVTNDTLAEIERVIATTGNLLMRSKIARFGAPLLSLSITSLGVSDISGDRVEIYLALGIPRPLNRIGLHLVI